MTELKFHDKMTVEHIGIFASDETVVRAARISVGQEAQMAVPTGEMSKLIGYLMSHRHGTPFEHNLFTFYVKAPIFVFREFHRHRIGFSYNEMSGRYTELLPEFYVPAPDRPMRQTGPSARPTFEAATPEDAELYIDEITNNSYDAWVRYRRLLDAGAPNEVARAVLPVNIMSQMYVTMNARSLMAFLSLRVHDPDATFVSYPQREIQMVAEQIESIFARVMPLTHAAFCASGRVGP